MSDLLSSFRQAARTLAAAPAFTITATAILGLGIGVTTAIFSVVDAVLLSPLPYPDGDRLVIICETNPAIAGHCVASTPNVADWAERARSFESLGLGREWTFTLRVDGGPPRGVSSGLATAGLFRALGVTPLAGRLLLPEDDLPAGGRVVVLSHALWERDFGADPAAVGKSLMLDGEPFTIVGVLPAGFSVPTLEFAQLWRPLHFDPRDEERRGWRGFVTVGRLAPGVTLARADAELSAIQLELAREHPQTNEGWGVRVRWLKDHVVGSVRPLLIAFSAAVGLLLLIACANVAALLLVRATDRQREFAIRAALGADARRIARQVFAEGLLLALLGGAAAVLLGAVAVRAFLALAPAGLPRIAEVGVNGTVLLFTLLVAGLTSIFISLVPALRAVGADPYRTLRETAANVTGRASLRMRRVLVVGELALSVMLVVGALLLIRNFAVLLRWQPGFDREGVAVLSYFVPAEKYRNAADIVAFLRRTEAEVAAVPGVIGVGGASAGPLFGGEETGRFHDAGRVPSDESGIVARWFDVSPGFFPALGVPIVRGRNLTESDARGSTTVALVNETFVRRFWPDTDPIGRVVEWRETAQAFEIAGVVADVRPFDPDAPAQPEIYWSNRQFPRGFTFLLVRTSGDGAAVIRASVARLQALEPDLQVAAPRTLSDMVDLRMVAPRFNMLLMSAFALVALVLAAAGLFGVVAYSVLLRGREIGIRKALGAPTPRVIGGIVREGVLLSFMGLGLGFAGAIGGARLLASLLSGVSTLDPLTFASAALVLSVIALVATISPALRASRVDPLITLRSD